MAAPKGTKVYLEQTTSAEVMADPARLLQVIDNLITNAIKFSPPGSTVTVKLEQTAATMAN